MVDAAALARYVQYTLAGQLPMRQLCPIIDRGHFIIHKVTRTRSVLTQKVLVTPEAVAMTFIQ